MRIFDDIFEWDGWGGVMRLGSGKCHLQIYDLQKAESSGLTHLKPIILLLRDLPKKRINDMSVRSSIGNIVTLAMQRFDLDCHRTQVVHYSPGCVYGPENDRVIEEKFEVVEFSWDQQRALNPHWRPLTGPLRDWLKDSMDTVSDPILSQ